MKLTKINKEFPDDYMVVERTKKQYVVGKSQRVLYKYVSIGEEEYGTARKIPKMIHHPVYRLLKDLSCYDLTKKEERIEFLSVLSVALLMDDYDLIGKRLFTMNTSIKEINNMADLNEFIEKLEREERRGKKIIKMMGIEEIAAQAAEGQDLAYEIED